MESVGLRVTNDIEFPGHGRPKGKETLGRCCQLLHYQVPYIGQGSFGVAYASLGKSEPWPCPSRWGEFVTPTRPTTRGFGHVDARSRWLCAARLDNVTPNTGRPCVATVLGGVSGPSNVRASDLIKSQWVLLLRHPAHPCPDPTPLKKQQQQ
ncbi:hypothetical protein V6N13_077727 [Hibiscus sabdariffa]